MTSRAHIIKKLMTPHPPTIQPNELEKIQAELVKRYLAWTKTDGLTDDLAPRCLAWKRYCILRDVCLFYTQAIKIRDGVYTDIEVKMAIKDAIYGNTH